MILRRTMFEPQSGISFKLTYGDIINNNFNDILVVGNGFDLFLGLKTKYSDFFNFIILYRIFYLIKSSYIFSIKSLSSIIESEYRTSNSHFSDLIEIVDLYVTKHSANQDVRFKSLTNAINSNFFSNLLKHIFRDQYSDLFEKIDSYFNTEINKAFGSQRRMEHLSFLLRTYQNKIEIALKNAEKSCNGWTDVEQFIEYLVLGSNNLKSKFSSKKIASNDFNYINDAPNDSSSYYEGLQKFCDEFSLYLEAVLESKRISESKNQRGSLDFSSITYDINSDYIESLKYRSKDIIFNFSFLKLKCILDFNYTKTTDKLIDLYTSRANYDFDYRKPYIYHINGEIDSKNLIFGYGRDKAISVSKECFCFEKFTQRIIKNTQFVDFNNLLADKFNVLIFGHSCSLADRDVFHKLLSSDNLGIAVIFCHDIPSLISTSNNLQEILGQDRIETLLDYSEYIELVSRKPNSVFSLKDEEPHLKSYDLFDYDFKRFHPVLFFCVESKNDEFLQNKKV